MSCHVLRGGAGLVPNHEWRRLKNPSKTITFTAIPRVIQPTGTLVSLPSRKHRRVRSPFREKENLKNMRRRSRWDFVKGQPSLEFLAIYVHEFKLIGSTMSERLARDISQRWSLERWSFLNNLWSHALAMWRHWKECFNNCETIWRYLSETLIVY